MTEHHSQLSHSLTDTIKTRTDKQTTIAPIKVDLIPILQSEEREESQTRHDDANTAEESK